MTNERKRILFLVFMIVLTIGIVLYYFEQKPKNFRVVFLDVGQGDAVFIESPSGRQMLIDGGPDKRILRELGKVMSFFDRSIDVVLATHPDSDHIGGLADVLKKYSVDYFIDTENQSETSVYGEVACLVTNKNIERNIARKNMIIDLGGGVYMKVLFPDRDVSGLESNTSSIVGKLSYGDIDFLLTGDSPKSIENYLVATLGERLESEVLKLGHHGSNTSSSEFFLRTVNPDFAIISAGKDNRYGHPHREVLDILNQLKIVYFNTADEGRIECLSNGLTFSCK